MHGIKISFFPSGIFCTADNFHSLNTDWMNMSEGRIFFSLVLKKGHKNYRQFIFVRILHKTCSVTHVAPLCLTVYVVDVINIRISPLKLNAHMKIAD